VKLVIGLLATVRRPVIPDFVRICCSRLRTDRGHLFALPDSLAVNLVWSSCQWTQTHAVTHRSDGDLMIIVAKRSKLFDSLFVVLQ
jgi:hypothetical protein